MSDTLTDFLLARIAEDEAAASRAGSFTPWTETFQNDNYGHLTVQPDRVQADSKAKRKIIEHHAEWEDSGDCSSCGDVPQVEYPCETLRFLALPYADHPDYREEWRP